MFITLLSYKILEILKRHLWNTVLGRLLLQYYVMLLVSKRSILSFLLIFFIYFVIDYAYQLCSLKINHKKFTAVFHTNVPIFSYDGMVPFGIGFFTTADHVPQI